MLQNTSSIDHSISLTGIIDTLNLKAHFWSNEVGFSIILNIREKQHPLLSKFIISCLCGLATEI